MSTLIRLELRRFWYRKLVRNIAVIVTGLIMVFGVVQLITHSPEPPSVEGMAEQRARDVEECRGFSTIEWQQFAGDAPATDEPEYLDYVAQFESAEAFADEQCNPMYFGGYVPENRFCYASLWRRTYRDSHFCPDVDEATFFGATDRGFFDESGSVEGNRPVLIIEGRTYEYPDQPNMGTLVNTSTSLMIVAIVIGASFVGAEYRAGTIENQLLWESRRTRIAAAKFTAAAVSATVMHAVMLIMLALSVVPAAFAGTFAGTNAEFWNGMFATIARGSLAAGLVATASAALALIVKNTAGSVGVMMGYGIIGTGLLFWLAPALTRWEIATNSGAFVTGGDVSHYLGERYPRVLSHGPWLAGLIVLIYTASLVALAIAIFNRRDID